MLPRDKFDTFHLKEDPFSSYAFPSFFLLDAYPDKEDRPIEVSYFISTYNRASQLARTLITFANQTFKNFEVLIVNDGSTQDLSWVNKFNRLFDVTVFDVPRPVWRSCPSQAYKFLLPLARAEIIALGHPEMMLANDALYYLYEGHSNTKRHDCFYYDASNEDVSAYREQSPKWVSLKPGFLPHTSGIVGLPTVNWTQNANQVEKISDYNSFGGFAGRNNTWHKSKLGYPWWFVASFKKSSGILQDMPIFDGHGIIDMWFISYRKQHSFLDVTPNDVLCYHQEHAISAISPDDEYKKYNLSGA